MVANHDRFGNPDAIIAQRFPAMCRTIVISWREAFTGDRKPHLFRSYQHPKRPSPDPQSRKTTADLLERNPGDDIDIPIWKVARATSAAPTYFEPIKMNEDDKGSTFIDGGFGANNPSEEVYYSVQQLRNNQQHAVGELVSIGTGKKESGKKEFLKLHRYINLAIKWATESEKTHESMLRISQRDDFSYSRFNVEQGLGKIKLDTWKGKQGARTLTLMRKKTQEYLQTGHVMEDVDAVAMRLVQIRHSRARQPVSDRWEQFCHGVEYSCFFSTCSARERVRVEDLRQHLQNAHSMTEEEIESSLEQCKRYALFESI